MSSFSLGRIAPTLALLSLVLLSHFAGCSGKPPKGPDESSAPALTEGEKLLTRMIETYAKADSYFDRGELRIVGRNQGQQLTESKLPFAVMLERPGKLHLHLYRATYVCDGTWAWGWDEDLPGFLLKKPAPNPVTLGDAYSDDALKAAFNGMYGGSLPAEMLLGADAMDLIRHGDAKPELMSDDFVGDRNCRRVRVKSADGNTVYWIDRENLTLRRIEFPTDRLALTLADTLSMTELKLTAEFIDAQLNTKVPAEAFQFDPPPQLKIVDKLDPLWGSSPPPPLAETLGRTIGDFKLRTLDGRAIGRGDLNGKVAVVLFVAFEGSQHFVLEALNAAQRKFGKRDDLMMLAVSIDNPGPMGIGDEVLDKAMKQAKLEVPLARLVDGSAMTAFDVRFVPNLFILDRQGIVQDNEVGLNPKLNAELGTRIDEVLAGKSLVEAARARYAARLKQFEQAQQAQAAISPEGGLSARVSLATKSQPKTLKLTQLWQNTEIKKPGHIVVAEEKGKPARIVVLDGLRAVGELDAAGKLVRTAQLDLPKVPEEAVVSFLRTTVDRDGKRYFAGSASAQQQLHLFDADFKKLLSFPDGTHAGISDLQMGDLDGDGRPEIVVGYWGVVGVQAISLDGIRQWSNRKLPENVQRLALTGPDKDGKRLVLCTTGLMTLAVLNERGETLKEIPVGNRAARLITAADLTGDGSVELCAITSTSPGTDVAIGFDAAGAELWNYPLPAGLQPVPEMQNEMIVGGKLLKDGTGLWVVAGADGTLHFLDVAGKPLDSFAWGAAIRGLAIGTLDGAPALFISDEKSVTALRFER
ncbi:MAG: redoxin domain-containing protein [Planctomycetia bacterium]|nr:redoxin domain-containing protein [Planctomycetia bacterium]